jgi:hypothetical protein
MNENPSAMPEIVAMLGTTNQLLQEMETNVNTLYERLITLRGNIPCPENKSDGRKTEQPSCLKEQIQIINTKLEQYNGANSAMLKELESLVG